MPQCAHSHRSRTSWRERLRHDVTSAATIICVPGQPSALEAEWPLQRWVELAHEHIGANRHDIRKRADQFARQQMAPNEAMMSHPDTRYGLAFGVLTPTEAGISHVESRLSMCLRRHLLLELGQALGSVGKHDVGARVLGALAHACATDPERRRPAAIDAHPDVASMARANHFEREVFTHWGTALAAVGGLEEAEYGVHKLAVRRGLWRTHWQRPLDHFEASLTAQPFWEAALFPDALALEAAFPQILAECQAMMEQDAKRFAKYHSRVVDGGGWSDVQFYGGCKRDRAHCELCPITARTIAAQPRINSVVHGSHFFSRLVPGTHLSKHCGPSNFRLRCHLALIVPDGLTIRVGSEMRRWEPGKCLIFDDSFEHEVWHEGTEDRVVLICDLWHPEVDLDKHIKPMLSEKQAEAMRHAMAGQHLYIQERTYSSGQTVRRGD